MGVDFNHVEFESITLIDIDGAEHEFHFRVRLFKLKVGIEAFEIIDGQPGIRQYYVIGDYDEEIFVIGGAEIYRLFLPLAGKLYLTEVHTNAEGDITFPDFDKKEWNQTGREDHDADDRNPHPYSFVVYSKLNKKQ